MRAAADGMQARLSGLPQGINVTRTRRATTRFSNKAILSNRTELLTRAFSDFQENGL